jgi:hypothetical protein
MDAASSAVSCPQAEAPLIVWIGRRLCGGSEDLDRISMLLDQGLYGSPFVADHGFDPKSKKRVIVAATAVVWGDRRRSYGRTMAALTRPQLFPDFGWRFGTD